MVNEQKLCLLNIIIVFQHLLPKILSHAHVHFGAPNLADTRPFANFTKFLLPLILFLLYNNSSVVVLVCGWVGW